jgi:folate-binding protein YgfZ
MNELWKQELTARGARFDAGVVLDFGEPGAEREALAAATTLHPIADGLLWVQGRDARTFLNSQLTADVQSLPAARAQYAAYCTPKGRILATLLVISTDGGFLLQLAPELAEPIATRLRKYVLRSAVQLTDVSGELVLIGIGGPGARQLVAGVIEPPPSEVLGLRVHEGVTAVALEQGCFEVVAPTSRATAIWDALARGARPGGDSGWRWRRIQAGIPWVTAPTQEMFVPQMANLEQIGAISFTKGCYPGQEIVARAQYRGEVKRRLFRGHTGGAASAGQPLFAQADAAQPVGHVTNAAPAPDSQVALLAVVQSESARTGRLRLGASDGPEVLLEPSVASEAA